MIIRKLTLLLFALFALSQYVAAYDGLWLEKKDGTRIGYEFEKDITISYGRDSVFIITREATAVYPFAEVWKITFADNVSGIRDAKADAKTSKVVVAGHRVELTGFAAGMPVGVYDLTGRQVMSMLVKAEGTTVLSLASLPKGTYIVKVEKTSVKLIRK